jgi:endonuclease/exonuclease/phosphatase family metal-dependent hydrolase
VAAEVSLRAVGLSRGTPDQSPLTLRGLIRHPTARARLGPHDFRFSVVGYNLGLLVAPASYKGTDRTGAITEVISRVRADRPDVVGLCEVFADGERDRFRSELRALYPYVREGPDEADLESDGGLLLLSRWPFLATHSSIYRQCAGADCWANKGVLFARVQPSACPCPIDLFFTHTQNLEESGGRQALYSQLAHLGTMRAAFTGPADVSLVFGDLNIPAEVPEHHRQLVARVGPSAIDLWPVTHPTTSGTTFDASNDFYADSADAPSENSRLDYMLLVAGSRCLPAPPEMQVLRWAHHGRQISDHYGLRAEFDRCWTVELTGSAPVSRIRASARRLRCIETTAGPGADEVSVSLTLTDQHGHSAEVGSPVVTGVDNGDERLLPAAPFAQLVGDPGDFVDVTVTGTEHDPFDSAPMGTTGIRLSHNELSLAHGRPVRRWLPFLTSGGEYAVEIGLSVD